MRILLLSLYYPPLNTIASFRLKAFEKYLTEAGHLVDVITRHYDDEQQKGQSMLLGKEPSKNFDEQYIKDANVIYTNFDTTNTKLSFSAKLPPGIKGIYNFLQLDVFHYGWIHYAMMAFEKEFKYNTYDYIVASYGPPIVMLLAKQLSKQYNIPYVIDFRDSYIDEKDQNYQLFIKKRMQHVFLKNASALLFSTDGMRTFFQKNATKKLKKIPSCTVYNGVEENGNLMEFAISDNTIVKQFNEIKKNHSHILLHTGTLYEGQNISFFINAIAKYNKHENNQVALIFLGLTENKNELFHSQNFIYYLSKVKHSTSLYLQKQASALLLPIWDKRYTGFSGKTLEYLHSGNIIITSPAPQQDLFPFFELSQNVIIPANEEALLETLEQIRSKKIVATPLLDPQKLYRKYWVNKMADFLSQNNTL